MTTADVAYLEQKRQLLKQQQQQQQRDSDPSASSASSSLSSFQSYPASKPFVNTDWNRPQHAPLTKAFPESNRDLILGSLRRLQDKLTRLETSQSVDQNADTVVHDVHESSSDFRRTHHGSGPRVAFDTTQHEEIGSLGESRISEAPSSTERRVAELEKKLAEMRKLLNEDDDLEQQQQQQQMSRSRFYVGRSVIEAPTHEHDFDKSQLPSPSSSSSSSSSSTSSSGERFESDSKGFVPSSTTRKLSADDLIDQHVRQAASSSGSTEEPRPTRKTPVGQRSKTAVRAKRKPAPRPTQEPTESDGPRPSFRSKSAENLNTSVKSAGHYRLKLGDIPFVVGKSTTPSHHLGSNIQNVISLLKQHHPRLCNSSHAGGCAGHHHHNHCHNAASVAITTVRGNSQIRTPQKRSARPGVECATNRRAEPMKRSVSVPHLEPQSARPKPRRPEPKTRTAKTTTTTAKSAAPTKLNRVKETSVNCRESTASGKSEPNGFDLNELLKILQEEYTKLVLQHYELTKKIATCYDDLTKNELELNAEFLDQKMRIKSRQIAKLKIFKLNRALKSVSSRGQVGGGGVESECGHRHHFGSVSQTGFDYSAIERPRFYHSSGHHHHHHHGDSADLHYLNHQITHQVHNDHLASHHHHHHHNHSQHLHHHRRDYEDEEATSDDAYPAHHCHHFMTSAPTAVTGTPSHSHTLKLFKDIKNLQSRIQNDQLKL